MRLEPRAWVQAGEVRGSGQLSAVQAGGLRDGEAPADHTEPGRYVASALITGMPVPPAYAADKGAPPHHQPSPSDQPIHFQRHTWDT